jgi:hypothetical protein
VKSIEIQKHKLSYSQIVEKSDIEIAQLEKKKQNLVNQLQEVLTQI